MGCVGGEGEGVVNFVTLASLLTVLVPTLKEFPLETNSSTFCFISIMKTNRAREGKASTNFFCPDVYTAEKTHLSNICARANFEM